MGKLFKIPYSGRLLCTGRKVRSQAFAYRSVLGLQFHLELTEEIIRNRRGDIKHHQMDKIIRETPMYLAESNRLCHLIAEDFVNL